MLQNKVLHFTLHVTLANVLQVRHSQKLNEAPLRCWIICEETGDILCAHCTCMAGIGETCTHIAAILFYLEAINRTQGTKTCTQSQCSWIIPSYLKSAEYLRIKEIDFSSAKAKKRKLDEDIEHSAQSDIISVSPNEETICDTMPAMPTTDEMELLFKNLSLGGTKPAVLSLIPPYCDEYAPKSLNENFPKQLQSLYDPMYANFEYHQLLDTCESILLNVTEEMARSVEEATKLQSKSNLWFKYRAGRVTASRMKAICHTSAASPSQSLIKSICYPEAFAFTSKQTIWGCKHEKSARDLYYKNAALKHRNLKIEDSGLVINPRWPFIGASPDGFINCDCCGRGVVEIKCPYCHRNDTIESAVKEDKNFCIKEQNGSLQLDHNHCYYYQVQTQMFVCDVKYSDFCVATFGEDSDLHVECIYQDQDFWEECISKAKLFFTNCLLPELLGRWYTRPNIKSSATTDQLQPAVTSSSFGEESNVQKLYCFCRGPEEGTMIGCDNPDCKVEWFHIQCLRLPSIPKGRWYCPECQKLRKNLIKKVK